MIDLTKGSAPLSLEKGARIIAKVSWHAATDYDLGAEILYTDGSTESIATFPARGVDACTLSRNGTVKHLGDAVRGAGTASETIWVHPDPELAAVAFWAYSAQSNGTGSFRRYMVSMEVTDGTNQVRINASNASDDDAVYTCVPGIITFTDGIPSVAYAELYSDRHSELRPTYAASRLSTVTRKAPQLRMGGPRNVYK